MAGFGLYDLVGHAHSFVVPTYEPLLWFMIVHTVVHDSNLSPHFARVENKGNGSMCTS